jgi:3(or 17)beta-hydroxysteroid dehydrogenase
MGRLAGKTALVTGASGGLGAGICRRLVAEGAWIAVADIDDAAGVTLARDLGKSAVFVHLDVRHDESWQAAIPIVLSQFGGLDILVNNAGVLKPATIEDATADDWRTAMAVNGEGVFLGCKHGVAAMKTRSAEDGAASIINIASTMATKGVAKHPIYSATKAAVCALTRAVARHCGEQGYAIRVNTVLPGAVPTAMLRRNVPPDGEEEAYFEAIRQRNMIRRLGTPEDVAGAVAYLASADASFVTGIELVVDGGNGI